MPQVSVVVLTYNPDNRKLRQTLAAAAAQKEVSFEILISDDGSARKDFTFLPEYMQSLGVENYRLLEHRENRGTVESCLSAVKEAAGQYVFLTSPGDYLFDEYVLRDLCAFADKQNAKLCFGNAVFYNAEDGKPQLTQKFGAPRNPSFYAPDAPEDLAKLSFFGGNCVIGASYFRDTKLLLSTLEQLRGESKYTEDNPSTAFAMAEGHRLYYCDRNVVWYEDGTGVSTGASEKWAKLLHEDALRSFRKLKGLYPKDPYVDITYRNLSVSNRLRRIAGKLFAHPLLMLRLRRCKKAPGKPIECTCEDLARLSRLLETQ